MTDPKQGKAPFSHRLAVWFFSILFGLLIFWLTGFLLKDIRTWPGPAYADFEQRMLDANLIQRRSELEREIAKVRRRIDEQQQQQRILQESTAASRETMNQLLEFQRLNLEKGAELSPEEREALATSQKLFLANQQEFQELNAEVGQDTLQLHGLEQEQRELAATIDKQRAPINQAFQTAMERHQRTMAAIELAVLIPFALVAFLLFLKGRHGAYTPLIYAFGLAVLVQVGLVLHEYFPTRYFKYILILVAIVVVAWILVHLLRMIAFPKRGWLLKRYREAYERFECPICDYPIRRGPLRFVYWTRRSLKKLGHLNDESEPADKPYVCPSCGTQLFEECLNCHKTRHSLLPACEHCGDEREIGAKVES